MRRGAIIGATANSAGDGSTSFPRFAFPPMRTAIAVGCARARNTHPGGCGYAPLSPTFGRTIACVRQRLDMYMCAAAPLKSRSYIRRDKLNGQSAAAKINFPYFRSSIRILRIHLYIYIYISIYIYMHIYVYELWD